MHGTGVLFLLATCLAYDDTPSGFFLDDKLWGNSFTEGNIEYFGGQIHDTYTTKTALCEKFLQIALSPFFGFDWCKGTEV